MPLAPSPRPLQTDAIHFHAEQGIFHLRGRSSSYLIALSPSGDLHQLHWGRALGSQDLESLAEAWLAKAANPLLETQRREYAGFGSNDLRPPALHLEHADGSRLSGFSYQGHEIVAGKPDFTGWPGTYAEEADQAATLKLRLKDELTGQLLELYYTLYPDFDVVVRRSVLTQGPKAGFLTRLMAASVDFPAGDYHLLSLAGDWARERMIQHAPLLQGISRLESRRGISSHTLSPFAVLSRGEADEDSGEAFAFALVYSGNWLIETELQPSGRVRVNAGINDFDFRWRLEPGETFVSPECVLAYSGQGLGALSRRFHRLVRTRVARGPWRDRERPILVNSWEAHYFKFDHAAIMDLARRSKDIGADLLVLDDGWFGKRDSDNCSLGDWFDDTRKLPKGIKGLSAEVKAMGLKFGLWFEPEAISPDSELYRRHPDWALAVPGRPATTSRTQYVLDMGRGEVRDHLFERMAHYIEDAGLDYIKWDMNRPLWEVGNAVLPANRQAEISHRYVLGVYDLMGRLRDRFPELLVEGCCGGGGRFDLGVLCYHPQFWASDNSDGLDRIFIQYGGSLFLPAITQTAHISEVPNHQTSRVTPLSFRALVAMSGNLGLELNLSKMSGPEKAELAAHLDTYRAIRQLVNRGDFHRLENPFKGPRAAWSFVSEDRREALVFAYQPRAAFRGHEPLPLKLKGLDPSMVYEVKELGRRWSGDYLMHSGLVPVFGSGDYQALIFQFSA